MAGFLTFTVIGVDKVAAGLAAMKDVVKDWRPFWRLVFAPKFFGAIQDRFALEGQGRGPSGRFGEGHWAPLSPAYAAWKARHYPGRRILEREGWLKGSMAWTGTVGQGGIFDPQPMFVVAGTAIPYGRAHQQGRPHMPARPFISPPDPDVYAPLMRDWILRESGNRWSR